MGFASQPPIRLEPNFTIPIVIIVAAIPALLLSPWLAGVVGLFGVFLLVQTASIRLEFTDTGLDVLRNNDRFRQFPYRDWTNWKIFWSPVPILFYFREVNSIHFIPVLFDAAALRDCLDRRVPLDRLPNAIEPPQS